MIPAQLVAAFVVAAWGAPAQPPVAAMPKTAENTSEVEVTLFGQRCRLTGPMSKDLLLAMHRISPEQTPPPQRAEAAREQLERLKKTPQLPPALDKYRDQLTRRLEAQVAFFNGLAAARKARKVEPLLAATRDHVLSRNAKRFAAEVQKLDASKNVSLWPAMTVDTLFESFSNSIEPSPEEEFHRALPKIRAKYDCSFDEAKDEEDVEEEE